MTDDDESLAGVRRFIEHTRTNLLDFSTRELYTGIGAAWVGRHLLPVDPTTAQALDELHAAIVAELDARTDLEVNPFPDMFDPGEER
jgi:hypothetical protein